MTGTYTRHPGRWQHVRRGEVSLRVSCWGTGAAAQAGLGTRSHLTAAPAALTSHHDQTGRRQKKKGSSLR